MLQVAMHATGSTYDEGYYCRRWYGNEIDKDIKYELNSKKVQDLIKKLLPIR